MWSIKGGGCRRQWNVQACPRGERGGGPLFFCPRVIWTALFIQSNRILRFQCQLTKSTKLAMHQVFELSTVSRNGLLQHSILILVNFFLTSSSFTCYIPLVNHNFAAALFTLYAKARKASFYEQRTEACSSSPPIRDRKKAGEGKLIRENAK